MPGKRRPRKKAPDKNIAVPEVLEEFYKNALSKGLLESTFQILLQNGYNNIATLSSLEESDLKQLDITLAQKSVLRKLLRFVSTTVSPDERTLGKDVGTDIKVKDGKGGVFRPKIQIVSSDDEIYEEPGSSSERNHGNNNPRSEDLRGNISSEWTSDSSSCTAESEGDNNTGDNAIECPTKIDSISETSKNVRFPTVLKKGRRAKIDFRLTRKDKQVTTKNTFVQGASGCLIGENIQVIKNEINEEPIDPIVRSLEHQTQMELKGYKGERKLFVKTGAYKIIKEELESLHFITIIGRPGDGKTFMAMNLLLEYKSKRKCFIIESADMWDSIAGLDLKHKIIILVDDIFGTYVYDDLRARPWISRLENIEKVIKQQGGNLYIIFTSRTYITQDIKPFLEKSSIFKAQNIINLSSEEFCMLSSEKYDILERHLNFHHRHIQDEHIIKAIVSTDPPHGFPHCVKLFTTSHFLYSKGRSFFNNPIKCLNAEIERFRRFDKYKYCVLVLMAMHEGKISDSFFDDMKPKSDYVKVLICVSGLPDSTPFSVLKDALHSMLLDYVRRKTEETYIFDHESISEAVCYCISKTNTRLAIEKMDLKFLNKRTKTQSWKDRNNALLITCIPRKLYVDLWNRLLREIREGNVKQSIEHQAWNDAEFVQMWKQLVTNGENEDRDSKFLVELKTSKDGVHVRNLFYWAVFHNKHALIDLMLSYTCETQESINDVSIAFVTACYKGASINHLQQMLKKGARLHIIDSAMDFLNLPRNSRDSPFSGHRDIYYSTRNAFGDEMADIFMEGGMTPLQAAATCENIEVAKFLLKSGCKVDQRQNYEKTAIHFAAVNDCVHIQDLLLESVENGSKKSIVNMGDKDQRTALHYASTKKMVSLLLNNGANVNLKDIKGHTPLLYRAKYGITSCIIEVLCEKRKCNVNAVDNAHRNALHITIRSNLTQADMTSSILKFSELGLDFNCRTYSGDTPLISLIKIYHQLDMYPLVYLPAIIQLMSECGANMNAFDNYGKTALHYTIEKGHLNMTKCLLLHGCNPTIPSFRGCSLMYLMDAFCGTLWNRDCMQDRLFNLFKIMTRHLPKIKIKNSNGENMLHCILRSKLCTNTESINALVKKGIDVNETDNSGTTAIMLASSVSIDILQTVIASGGNVDACDKEGKNALFYIADEGPLCTSVVDCLLKQGLSINYRDNDGQTPLLSLLSKSGSGLECVRYLLSKCADISHYDSTGKGVFHYLFSSLKDLYHCSNSEMTITEQICDLLLKNGANINLKDDNGNSPLLHHCIIRKNFKRIKRFLTIPSIDTTIANNDGCNVLHLLLTQAHGNDAELEIIDIIDMLYDRQFDFEMCDKVGQTPLLYALENSLSEIALKLFQYTCVFDTDAKKMKVCKKIFQSEILNLFVHGNRHGFEIFRKVERQSNLLRSDKRCSLIKNFICSVKGGVFPDGSLLPHCLVTSKLSDCVVEQIFSLILENATPIDVVDKQRRTVLHVAIQYASGSNVCRRINVIRLLLDHGFDPSCRDSSGRTALHYCMLSKRSDEEALQIMKCLLERKGDPLIVNDRGKSAFEVLANNTPRLDTVLCMLQSLSVPFVPSNKFSEVVAFSVARQLNTTKINSDVFRYLIWGVHSDFHSISRRKILHVACMWCNFLAVNKLLSSMMNSVICKEINMTDDEGKSPLHLLISSEMIEKEGQLKNISLNSIPFHKRYDHMLFSLSHEMTGAALLLQTLLELPCTDPNIKDNDGNTPLQLLMFSQWYGIYFVQAVDLLLKHGANVNERNSMGVTPLMLAVSNERFGSRTFVTGLLLHHGALVDSMDNNGNDISWYARKGMYAVASVEREFDLMPKGSHADDLFP